MSFPEHSRDTRTVTEGELIDVGRDVGVDAATARALFAALPAGSVSSTPATPPDVRPAFAAQDAISRVVQVLIAAGSVLVVGAFAWWISDVDPGRWVTTLVCMVLTAMFLAAATVADRRDEPAMVAWFAASGSVLAAVSLGTLLYALKLEVDTSESYPVSAAACAYYAVVLAAESAVFVRFRRPLVLLPLAASAVTIGAVVVAGTLRLHGEQSFAWVLVVWGAASIAFGAALDLRGQRPFALWPHLVGAGTLVIAVPLQLPDDWTIGYLVLGVTLMLVGTALGRMSLLGFGGAAAWIAVTWLAPSPYTIVASGLLAIAAGVWLARDDNPVRTRLRARQTAISAASARADARDRA